MAFYAGAVDGFRVEAVTHANIFDRLPPAPPRYGASRSLMIRLFLPRPVATHSQVKNESPWKSGGDARERRPMG